MSDDTVLQYRVAPEVGRSCQEGEWTDVCMDDGSFMFTPNPLLPEASPQMVHVQVRVKPSFVPGYYRLKNSPQREVDWFMWRPDPGSWERVEVTPVDDER